MVHLPRYSLMVFIVTAIVGVVFIASATITHDENGGLVLGEQTVDPLGEVNAPEGVDVVVVSDVPQLPENVLKRSELPRNESKPTTGTNKEPIGSSKEAIVIPTIVGPTTDDDGVNEESTKKIVIKLGSQTMEIVEHGVVLNAFKISSGKRGMQTPTGTFKVLNKNKRAYSKTYGLYMPYWMAFTTMGHGIHELPEWPGGYKEGENHLGTPVSHGCVRLGVGSAKAVFEWAEVGTVVEVVQG